MSTCPNGHVVGSLADRYCPTCGAAVILTCPSGHAVEATSRFCSTCGLVVPTRSTGWAPPRPRNDALAAAYSAVPPGASGAPAGGRHTAEALRSPEQGVEPGRPRGSRRTWVLAISISALAILVVVLVVLALNASPRTASTAPTATTAPPATSGSATATTGVVTSPQQAEEVTSLLSASLQDRQILQNAVDVIQQAVDAHTGCPANVSQAVGEIQRVESNRLSQLSALSSMSLSPLPGGPAALATLERAWSLSSRIDRDFGAWAAVERAHDCSLSDTTVASYRATSALDPLSTQIKTRFVELWNPIARSLSLPSAWTPNEI